jgi:ligand-binding SRPBCC domain-containing protein
MWKFQHSVECQADRGFAWRFWTDVNNWADLDPAVESVALDGPFQSGTRGSTKTRDSATVLWLITEVEDRRRAVIEIEAPGAVARFVWRFEDSAGGTTRMTQEVSFEGERADEYAAGMGKELEKNIPAGMERAARRVASAARKSR